MSATPHSDETSLVAFVTGGSGTIGRALIARLRSERFVVRALARNDASAATVARLGAEVVRGDLRDLDHVLDLADEQVVGGWGDALHDCDVVIHAAARFHEGGSRRAYEAANVAPTRALLAVARQAQVRRFVYVGAAGCLVGGHPVIDADETWPLQRARWSPYFRSKAIADDLVRQADAPGFATCSVRPGLVWGGIDDPFEAGIVDATRAGKMTFIDGGRHRIVTSHVDNTVHAIVLAARRGGGGRGFYVFDDGDIEIKDLLGSMITAHGLDVPDKAVPLTAARVAAALLTAVWKLTRRPGLPPISKELVRLNGGPFLVSDRSTREGLGYEPVITRADGLAALADRVRGSASIDTSR